MKYRRKSHSKYLVIYHLIFVVNYRKPLLIRYGDLIKQILLEIAQKSDFAITELEVDRDHVHLLIDSDPKLSPLQITRRLKQESTYRAWQAFPELSNYFWKEKTFWSNGYFCCSVGNASLATIKHYIASQG